jgi:hypothetical protein
VKPSPSPLACGPERSFGDALSRALRCWNVAHGAADGVANSVQPNSHSLRWPPRRRPGRRIATAAEYHCPSATAPADGQGAPPVLQRTVRVAGRAHMERRAPQGSWPRAQRASTSDSPQVSERSGRRPRSELCGGPRDRGAEGSLRRRRRPRNLSAAGCPRGPLHALPFERESEFRTTVVGRHRSPAAEGFMRRGARDSRWSN